MAKKIGDSAKNTDGDKRDLYPWLRLLELEVLPERRQPPRQGRGRPPNPFKRNAVHITLTEDELAVLDELSSLLSERFGGRVHRGHMVAFLSFYLHSRLQRGDTINLPPDIQSLSDLAKYLDKLKG